MSDTTASPLDVLELPGGLGAMLAEARQALAQSTAPNNDVQAVADKLQATIERLDTVNLNLELLADIVLRLVPAWNVLAENVDALAAAADKPLARLGLALATVPRV